MKQVVPIWEKSNLTLAEASAYSGIGVNKLREITNNKKCRFVLWVGNKRLIKRRLLDEYIENEFSKSLTTTSSGGLLLPLQRGIVTAHPTGWCRKHFYWSAYKAVLLESSFLDTSACSLIYFCTASSVILPIVST